MVAGSDNLVSLVHKRGVEGIKKSGVEIRLGWFTDKRGIDRWGIELASAKWLDEQDR
jgi:hypothetical protein